MRRWVGGGALPAVLLVVAIAMLAGPTPYTVVGNADPGRLVAWGTPVLRLIADLAGMTCAGCLAFVVFCTRPRQVDLLSGAAYGEVRLAGVAAWVWGGCALALVPFSAADTAGVPLSQALAHLSGFIGALEGPKAWLVTAALAIAVAVTARLVLRWQPVAGLCAVAVLALLPPLVTAHGSSDSGHDLTLAALLVHVPAAAIWFGVLLSVLRRLSRTGTQAGALLTRYDRVAWWSWLVLAASGLVLSVVMIPPGQLFGDGGGYGLALIVKAVLVLTLGLGGRLLRRQSLRALEKLPGRRAFLVRLGAVEAGALMTVTGLSVGLTHLPVPGFLSQSLDTARLLLGYDLPGPPTVARLVLDWRPDLVFGTLAVILAVGYLRALRRAAPRWPRGRTAAWLLGCLVLLMATSSGIGRYAEAMFSMHIAAHMLISMLVPVLLALGAPLSLLRAETTSQPLPGPGETVVRSSRSRLVRVATHPLVSLVLFAGSPFALYFTGLFDAANRFHWAHLLINAWFLAVGYLFCWPLIGPDPAPRPLPNLVRLGMLLATMPADIVFGALLIGTHRLIGNGPAAANMYQALALPWVPDLAADQRIAGVLALVLGEVTLMVMLATLLAGWQRVDTASGLGVYEDLARRLPGDRMRAEPPQPQAVGHDEQ